VEENVSFFLRHRQQVYNALLIVENFRRSTSRTLLVTLEWIEFGRVHKNLTG